VFKSKRSRWQQQKPAVPDGIRVYAIGDVHGCADLLRGLLERIDKDKACCAAAQTIEVFLGDYVDRGPASREVIDLLLARSQSSQTVPLKGNHETFVLDFLEDPSVLREWRAFGGLETLMSYGLAPNVNPDPRRQLELATQFRHALPDEHHGLLAGSKTSFTCGDYFFVHAGVRPGVALADQREQDLLWIRDDFLQCREAFAKMIVHGHTPVIEPQILPNRINIDTGAYATGRLTCLVLEGTEIRFL
jgi:serine/threonine protein phosphatase 1